MEKKMELENKHVAIKHYLDGFPSESNLEIKSTPLPLTTKVPDVLIVRNLFLSIDPYQINRMKKHSSSQKSVDFAKRLEPGERIDAFGIGRVVVSSSSDFNKDDVVVGVLGWEDYSVVQIGGGSMLRRIDTMDHFPLSYHVSVLGPSGFTAYSGFYDICKPKKGEKVFVSAASGSVGNLVGQFAKLSGCYVVGSAGSKKKVDLLKDKLGFDDAFNYKEEPDLKSALKRCFPDGIDIYFDNVGGRMLEAAITNMNSFGRVAVCGVISEYTDEGRRAVPDMLDVVYKRLSIRGFLAYDHLAIYDEFISTTADHLRNGRLHTIEDISQGLASIPSSFAGLFRGENVGKKLVQLPDMQEDHH